MSLFGDDDDGAAVLPRARRTHASSGGNNRQSGSGGLFGDDADPWLPTPKKKIDVSDMLDGADIPDLYIDLFDSAARGNRLSSAALAQMMTQARLSQGQQDRITSLLGVQHGADLTRGLANVAFLLIALAQQGEELSMDAIDDRKRGRLPVPDIALPERASTDHTTPPTTSAPNTPTQPKTQARTATPVVAPPSPRQSAPAEPSPRSPARSTQESAVSEQRPSTNGHNSHAPAQQRQVSQEEDPWSSGPSHQSPYQPASLSDNPAAAARSSSAAHDHTSHTLSDFNSVIITALPDKEGMPLWKHVNYSVKSSTRKSEVVRRYSDFAWLFECLVKKYPSRQVPLLPPKRLAGNGIYIRADASFLEKRRRGLARFTNFLEQHPVLNQDSLVTTFLTVPSELSIWRRQAGLTIQEEFEDRYLSQDLEASLPNGIEEWGQRTQLALRGAVESFTELVHLQERIIKKRESLAVDQLRFGLAIEAFGEGERQNGTFNTLGRELGPPIVRSMGSVAKYHTKVGGVQEEEKRREEDGILENLKRHRDALLSMAELFTRHARGAGDNVVQLEKRIVANQAKIVVIESKPEAATPSAQASRVADVQKLKSAIASDGGRIVKLKERRVLIRECIWQELQYFEKRQAFLPYAVAEYASTKSDIAAKQHDLADRLAGDVE